MPPTLYSTQELAAVVANLKTPNSALLDRYFTAAIFSDKEEVAVDIEKGGRTIAPLVAPHIPARRRKETGHATRLIRPAYVKDLTEFRPEGSFHRVIGEAIGGELTPEERMNRRVIAELEKKIRRIIRREEVIAAVGLRTGEVTLVGEDYPSQTVDFQRDNTLTPTALATTARWTESTSKPLRNLAAWGKLVRQASGVNPIDVIMGDAAFTSFVEHASVVGRLDTRNITGNQLQVGQQVSEGLSFQGTVDRFNIFTYSGWYVDPLDGQEKEIWPHNWVGMTAPGELGCAGTRLYGAIHDLEAGMQSLPYFAKMFDEQNPSARNLLVQSSPLPAVLRPDATLGVQVQDAS